MSSLGTLFFRLQADSAPMRQALGQVQGQLTGLTNTANILRTSLVGIAGGAGFTEFVFLAGSLEQARVKLDNITKSMRGAAGFTKAELSSMADEMRESTTATKAQLLEAEYNLSKFSMQLRGGQFKQALSAAQSLANLTGMDLPGAAELLGFILEDPERGLARLRRTFHIAATEQQRMQIEGAQKAGNVVQAQELLLKIIPKVDLPASTFTQLEKVRREFSDMATTIGEWFIPSVQRGTAALMTITSSFNQMSDSAKSNVGGVVVALSEALFLFGGFRAAIFGLGALWGAIRPKVMYEALDAVALGFGAVPGVTLQASKLRTALQSLATPANAAALGLGAVTIAIMGMMAKLEGLHEQANRIADPNEPSLQLRLSRQQYLKTAESAGILPGAGQDPKKNAREQLDKAIADMAKAQADLNSQTGMPRNKAGWLGMLHDVTNTVLNFVPDKYLAAPLQSSRGQAMSGVEQARGRLQLASAQYEEEVKGKPFEQQRSGAPPRPPIQREVQMTGLADSWSRMAQGLASQIAPQQQTEAQKQGQTLIRQETILAQIRDKLPDNPAAPGYAK